MNLNYSYEKKLLDHELIKIKTLIGTNPTLITLLLIQKQSQV